LLQPEIEAHLLALRVVQRREERFGRRNRPRGRIAVSLRGCRLLLGTATPGQGQERGEHDADERKQVQSR
jgi:hypothetical protein